MINFENTEIAFSYKSNQDLNRSWLLFRVLAKPRLVKAANHLLKMALKIRFPVSWIIKPTVYRQFVGGVTIAECQSTVRLLERYKVGAILDYSVEGGLDEKQIEGTLKETLRTIENARTDDNIPFAVFKPTAFGNLDELQEIYATAADGIPDHPDTNRYINIIDILCKAAFESGKPIMIDAEDSWYQDFVDAVVTKMMEQYNKEKTVVFNTLQMYRRDRLDHLKNALSRARDREYNYGVKFVRGAYMEKERRRAEKFGYPSPIHPDKPSTDKAFDDALTLAVENVDKATVFCGTHNERSCLHLIALLNEKGLARDDKRIWFSQLYGMSDHITFNLAHEGYNVVKYLPYGPVKHVMPYLFRRAEENTAMAGQTGRELRLVNTERDRRKNYK